MLRSKGKLGNYSARVPKGFTLLEILIALFIFALVSAIMVNALHTVFNSQSSTQKQGARLAQLQIALLLMSGDIEQTINRPIITANGSQEGFIGTANSITFTHTGVTNPLWALRRTTFQRVRYQLINENLVRITWPVPDQAKDTRPDNRILLNSVKELRFIYLDGKGRFQNSWPPADRAKGELPRAVRVFMTLGNWGKLSQLYIIQGQSGEEQKP